MNANVQPEAVSQPADAMPTVGSWTADALAAEAAGLEPLPPHAARALNRSEAGLMLDRLAVIVARGQGALEISIGTLFARLRQGDRLQQLGYALQRDYVQNRLGLAFSTVKAMAALADLLERRPVLREAVWRGEVSPSRARAVARVALGDDEAAWVEKAKARTVRALKQEVRALQPWAPPEDDAARWTAVRLAVGPERVALYDEVLALARRRLGAAATVPACVEAMCQEALTELPPLPDDRSGLKGAARLGGAVGPEGGGRAGGPPGSKEADDDGGLRAWLEEETGEWSFLAQDLPRAAPVPVGDAVDPFAIDAELRRLVALRARWDETLGKLVFLVKHHGLWRDMRFVSFGHWCVERLGLAPRAVEQRAWLERQLYEQPAVREALSEGRIGYAKALLVARSGGSVTVEWAEEHTCAQLEERIAAEAEAQMSSRGDVDLVLPEDVADLLDETIMRVQALARRGGRLWMPSAEAFGVLLEHCREAWTQEVKPLTGQDRRLHARRAGRCEAAVCSAGSDERHHLVYRSHGGGEADDNKVLLCASHHRAMHRGRLQRRVRPGGEIEWRVGTRPGHAPLEAWVDGPQR